MSKIAVYKIICNGYVYYVDELPDLEDTDAYVFIEFLTQEEYDSKIISR